MSELSTQQSKLLLYAQAILKPKPKLNGVEWANKHYYLSPESSALAGKWKTLKYQEDIINAMTDETTTQVTWWKSARIGYTKCINIAVAYHIHQNPASILLAQPTEDEAFGYAEDEIEPMIRDNEVIYDLIGATTKKGKKKREKTAKKTYPGGILELVGAHSPRNFRRRTVRIFIGDEIDGWEQQAGNEGDQITLGKKRTNDFWNRKIILGSSPGVEELSKIKPEFFQGDQRYFYVPCPFCKHSHKLEFKNLDWEKDEKGELIESSVGFFCPSCGSKYGEFYKEKMLSAGKWIASKPFKGHASFFLWTAYSENANSSWVNITKEFLETHKKPLKLKTYTNLVLGETFQSEEGEKIEEHTLLSKREDYTLVPNEAVILTCAVDTQGTWIEGEVKAWGEGDECWGIKHFKFDGKPSSKKVWEELDNIINATYSREDGIRLRISCTCIDSGGHFIDFVYKYCKEREHKRVFPIKGSSIANKPIVSRPSISNRFKVKLFMVGTDTAKELIFTRLKEEEFGEGYMHFNLSYDEEYFKQLTSEKIVNTYKKGVAVRVWKKTRARNEALDVTVYNLAALAILNPDYKKIGENLQAPKKKKTTKTNRTNGNFAHGWK